ncbi:hypothetical protein D3C85_1123760 [compost metagenome]
MLQRLHPRQQIEGQHWGDGHRNHQRGQGRDDEGDPQRYEQPPFHARQGEQRQEHQHDDDGGVEDGRTHLHGRVPHQFQRVQAVLGVLGPLHLQPAQHVLHAHHGIVDQSTDSDGQATEGHGVDRQAEVLEHQTGDEDRHRNGRQRNDGGAQRAEEEEQDRRDEHRGADQLALQGADRGLDEAGLAEGHLGSLHAGRQRLAHFPQRRLESAGQLDGIGCRLFLDAEDHRCLAFEAGVAALQGRGKGHFGDLPQQNRLAVTSSDGQVRQILQARRPPQVANQVFAPIELEEAPGGVRRIAL